MTTLKIVSTVLIVAGVLSLKRLRARRLNRVGGQPPA